MTTHNHGRVSPFGHPRINAHQATPRGLTQPITSFIGLAYQGIHRAPSKQKTQNIFHAQTTKNTKNKTTKKEKQTTTKQSLFIVVFLSHSRPLYSSHTTHHPNKQHPTNYGPKPIGRNQQDAISPGVIYRTTSVALDTQQHAIKTKQTIKTKTQTHLPKPLKTRGPTLFH